MQPQTVGRMGKSFQVRGIQMLDNTRPSPYQEHRSQCMLEHHLQHFDGTPQHLSSLLQATEMGELKTTTFEIKEFDNTPYQF